jgi:hypothetical protein
MVAQTAWIVGIVLGLLFVSQDTNDLAPFWTSFFERVYESMKSSLESRIEKFPKEADVLSRQIKGLEEDKTLLSLSRNKTRPLTSCWKS